MESRVTAKAGQYLTFTLKKQTYGVPIGAVREINRVSEITSVPQTPHFVAGVMNLRGKVIPVVDMRLKLKMEQISHTKETCIIVIEAECGQVGAIVDSVSGVVELTEAQIEPPPIVGSANSSNVMGMGKHENQVIILLDIVDFLSIKNLGEIITETKTAA